MTHRSHGDSAAIDEMWRSCRVLEKTHNNTSDNTRSKWEA
jgi:hypothetical protein